MSAPWPVSPDDRQDILRVAARLTTASGDSSAVVINAGPLLAWVEEATSRTDMRVRLRALVQHSGNCALQRRDEAVISCADNPEVFLRGAKVLYAFATAGGAA